MRNQMIDHANGCLAIAAAAVACIVHRTNLNISINFFSVQFCSVSTAHLLCPFRLFIFFVYLLLVSLPQIAFYCCWNSSKITNYANICAINSHPQFNDQTTNRSLQHALAPMFSLCFRILIHWNSIWSVILFPICCIIADGLPYAMICTNKRTKWFDCLKNS